MSELPSTWSWASVEELSERVQYGTSAKTRQQGAVAVLRMGNIVSGRLDFTNLKFLPDNHPEFPDLLLDDGDVLFNRTNSAELVGKTAVYRGKAGTVSFASYLIRLKLAGYIPELLSAFINSSMGREWVARSISQQVGQANVNSTKLRALRVPLMPEAEQRRIVAKLDALTARTARARADLDRVPALAERQRRAILRAAFAGDLTSDLRSAQDELTQSGWRTTTLGEVCDVQSGLALGKKRPPGARTTPRPYLRVANVQRGWLRLDEVKFMDVTDDEFRRLRLQDGDILMNEGGDLDKLGRGWVWREEVPDCVHQNHVFRLRLRDPAFPPEYVSHYANELGQKYVLDAGKQTTNLASISKSRVSAMPIVLPPSEEAHAIVARVARAFAELDRLVAEAAAARRLLDRLDQAILAKAFRGELVPQDPADEPASVLLDRIRAERAAAPAKARRGRHVAAA